MKKITTALTGLGILAYSALPAFAQTTIDPCADGSETGGTDFTALCDINEGGVGPVIQAIVTILLIAAVLIALFFLIWGGIRWITSGGDKGKVEEARKHIIAAIIGLILAFLAYFILNLVLGFFGLSLGTFTLPSIGGDATPTE